VNQLLEARKQMEKMMKQLGKGKMPAVLPDQAPSTRPPMSRRAGSKRKKRTKR
jgi:lauroyl/myristoyl acyltransferase